MSNQRIPIGTVTPATEPKLTIRILRYCNLRCPSCSTFSGPTERGMLRLEEFQAAVDSLARAAFGGVVNISGGETTYHPQLAPMLVYASERLPGSHIVLFTNGTWIGKPWWLRRLRRLASGPNVLIRFSLDRQHLEGVLAAGTGPISDADRQRLEREQFKRAERFLKACEQLGLAPGTRYDFAFKGARSEAEAYLDRLGTVPIYPIAFERDPAHRPKKYGFFAVDIDKEGRPWVYATLGHIPRAEPLGGLEALPRALAMNRRRLVDAARQSADRSRR